MKRNIDNLDESYLDIYQESQDTDFFDGTLPGVAGKSIVSQRGHYSDRLGFVEDMEARLDELMAKEAEEEQAMDILMESMTIDSGEESDA